MEWATGFEPALPPWHGGVRPLTPHPHGAATRCRPGPPAVRERGRSRARRRSLTCLSEESNLVPPAPQAGALSGELQRPVGRNAPVDQPGFEPGTPACKTGVIPLSPSAQIACRGRPAEGGVPQALPASHIRWASTGSHLGNTTVSGIGVFSTVELSKCGHISTTCRRGSYAWVAGFEPASHRFWRPVAQPIGSPT